MHSCQWLHWRQICRCLAKFEVCHETTIRIWQLPHLWILLWSKGIDLWQRGTCMALGAVYSWKKTGCSSNWSWNHFWASAAHLQAYKSVSYCRICCFKFSILIFRQPLHQMDHCMNSDSSDTYNRQCSEMVKRLKCPLHDSISGQI